MLSRFELHRQIFHIVLGLVTVSLLYFELLSALGLLLLIIFGALLSIVSKYVRLPIISWFLDKFERKEVRATFPGRGVIFFFIGVLLSVQLFEKQVTLAALMILTLGDSVSHLYGAQFGVSKNIFNKQSCKLLEGTLAGMLAGFLGALLFVSPFEALLASVGAMSIEAIDITFNKQSLDDNLLVPLVAGTVIVVLRLLF